MNPSKKSKKSNHLSIIDTIKSINSVGQLISASADTLLTHRRHQINQEKLAEEMWIKFLRGMKS